MVKWLERLFLVCVIALWAIVTLWCCWQNEYHNRAIHPKFGTYVLRVLHLRATR